MNNKGQESARSISSVDDPNKVENSQNWNKM